MSELTQKQTELLQHTLGADSRYKKNQWGFRNHYCSEAGCTDHDELLAMEKIGLLKSGERFGSITFWATRKGAEAIGFKPYQIRKTSLAA